MALIFIPAFPLYRAGRPLWPYATRIVQAIILDAATSVSGLQFGEDGQKMLYFSAQMANFAEIARKTPKKLPKIRRFVDIEKMCD